MPLQKCARCQKLFFKVDTPICEGCAPEEENDYSRIRDALAANPNIDAQHLAEKAEVSLDCVLRMLREGRIESAEAVSNAVCGRCGAPAISATKRLCEKCLYELDRECAEAVREMQQNLSTAATGNDVRRVVDAKRGVISAEELNRALSRKKPADSESKQRMVIRDRLQGKRNKP